MPKISYSRSKTYCRYIVKLIFLQSNFSLTKGINKTIVNQNVDENYENCLQCNFLLNSKKIGVAMSVSADSVRRSDSSFELPLDFAGLDYIEPDLGYISGRTARRIPPVAVAPAYQAPTRLEALAGVTFESTARFFGTEAREYLELARPEHTQRVPTWLTYQPPQTFTSNYDAGRSTQNVQVVGNMAYVADGAHGINILDISQPNRPTFISHYSVSDTRERYLQPEDVQSRDVQQREVGAFPAQVHREDLSNDGMPSSDEGLVAAASEQVTRDKVNGKAAASTSKEVAAKQAESSHEEVPPQFVCPLTLSLMRHPVIGPSGNSYERSDIMEWLNRGNTTEPVTNVKVPLNYPWPRNLALEGLIEDWKKAHPDHPELT